MEEIEKTICVTVLDTETGQKNNDDKGDVWYWTEGNGSCDCNREILFGHDTVDGICIRGKRYLIVKVEPMPKGYTLEDFNSDYPEELKNKYLKKSDK